MSHEHNPQDDVSVRPWLGAAKVRSSERSTVWPSVWTATSTLWPVPRATRIAVASALELGIAEDRAHRTWMDLLDDEKKRPEDERIDFVTIVTPNNTPIALAFVQAGINVVCDKPLCLTEEEAAELVAAREASGVVFAVTYNYTGYPMVREARARIANGEIGQVRRVFVEYHQGWLATRLEDSGQQQASWRTDPSKAGWAALWVTSDRTRRTW